MARVREKKKRSSRHFGAAETSKERAEWPRLQQRNVDTLGLLKGKESPQCHNENSFQVRQSRSCQKEKELSPLSRSPDRGGERIKVSENRTLARKRQIRVGAWRGKGGLHSEGRQAPRRRGRAIKENLPRRSRRSMSG